MNAETVPGRLRGRAVGIGVGEDETDRGRVFGPHDAPGFPRVGRCLSRDRRGPLRTSPILTRNPSGQPVAAPWAAARLSEALAVWFSGPAGGHKTGAGFLSPVTPVGPRGWVGARHETVAALCECPETLA